MAEASLAAVAPRVRPLSAEALAGLLEGRGGVAGGSGVLLVDSRPFADFNASHIADAVNVGASKLLKRRLLRGKVHVRDVLRHAAGKQLAPEAGLRVVVYDENSRDASALRRDAFAAVLLRELQPDFPSVQLLAGGFSEFSRQFARLCEGKREQQTTTMTTAAAPAPAAASGPTRILPHLYLGCQRDVLNEEAMRRNAIAYVLNASNTCPKPDFIPDSRFLRVPVDDGFRDKILPWLDASLDFIEEAEASEARVLVHCLAGISRSATIAIAYIMKRMDMSLDEAYRFVKEKRPSISPNFNFLGQLLDFEKKISRKVHGEGPPALALASLGLEEPARPKRRISLDFKTCGRTAAAGDGALESACQFSPVAEVCEPSPDKEEASARPAAAAADGFPFGPPGAVRRRGRPPPSHRGDSRRSWHEESNFEKTRSCHSWSEKEPAAPQRFSASLELICVS